MPIIIDQIKGALDEDKSLVIKKALKTVGLLVLQCFFFCQRRKMQ